MHEVFAQSNDEELRKAIGATSIASTEVSKYMTGLEQPWERITEFPKLPPNPIHKTNSQLATLVKKIDALLDVEAKQADITDALLRAAITSSADQDRAARRNLVVALISAFVGVAALIVAAMH
jgi:hypothetical protein